MFSRNKGVLIIVSTCIVILLMGGTVYGQSNSGYQIKIDEIQTNMFPQVKLYLSILNAQGFPITTLTSNDIALKEDGKVVEDIALSSYNNDEEPLAVAILIDTSGSMKAVGNQDPLGDAIEAASNFTDQLNADDLVAVITFADGVNVLQDLTTSKSHIPGLLETLNADGATAMNDAIVQALNLLSNRSERRAIVLITDGRPQGDQDYDYDTALNLAAVRSIPIYPIGFGDVDENQLTKLAELSGGIEQITPDSEELTDAFASVLALFRQQYDLTYTSALDADGISHEIEVQVNYQGESQSAFVNYIARNPVLVEVTQPEEGNVLSGLVEIQATVDNLNPLEQVELYVDDDLVQTFTQPPYSYSWDSSSSVAGGHSVRITAKDVFGFEDERQTDFVVELPKNEWIYWVIGLAAVVALVIIFPIVKRRQGKKTMQSIRKAILFEIDGLAPGHEWDLDKNVIHLGRKMAENDIRLKGIDASRNHAVIERSKQGFCIRSLKPENPVIVNGVKVEQRILQPGDMIQMGESVFRFEYRD